MKKEKYVIDKYLRDIYTEIESRYDTEAFIYKPSPPVIENKREKVNKEQPKHWIDKLYEESDTPIEAKYECSRCLSINKAELSNGSAGLCDFCEEIDYWHLKSVLIENTWREV